MKTVFLKERDIRDRGCMCAFFHDLFGPGFHAATPEEAEAGLLRLEADIEFVLTHRQTAAICACPYAYEVLLAIGRAAGSSAHIRIHVRSGGAGDG